MFRPTRSIDVTSTNQLLRGEVSESVRRRLCWDSPEWYGVTVDGGIDSDFCKQNFHSVLAAYTGPIKKYE